MTYTGIATTKRVQNSTVNSMENIKRRWSFKKEKI